MDWLKVRQLNRQTILYQCCLLFQKYIIKTNGFEMSVVNLIKASEYAIEMGINTCKYQNSTDIKLEIGLKTQVTRTRMKRVNVACFHIIPNWQLKRIIFTLPNYIKRFICKKLH